jgi:hypothetical protein
METENSSRIHNINSYPNNIILDHEIKAARKLVLSDEIGDFLFKKIATINAAGLENGLRNKRDGYSFFGEKEKLGDNIVNDFLVNYKMEGANHHTLFYIVFRRISQKYYIKNGEDTSKNDKSLIYVKLDPKYEIKMKKFFFIGDSLFYVEPSLTNENKVNIEFFSKAFQKKFELKAEDSPITIGRKGCKINLNATIYSKNQCTVFCEKNKWYICDGYEDKKSTNGTWLLVDNKHEISNSTSLKIGSNVIKIQIQ